MNQSPAAYLRALDQTAAPPVKEDFNHLRGVLKVLLRHPRDTEHLDGVLDALQRIQERDEQIRNLLPLLTDVVEAVGKRRDAEAAWDRARTPYEHEQADWDRAEARVAEDKSHDALVAAIAREAQSRGGRG